MICKIENSHSSHLPTWMLNGITNHKAIEWLILNPCKINISTLNVNTELDDSFTDEKWQKRVIFESMYNKIIEEQYNMELGSDNSV